MNPAVLLDQIRHGDFKSLARALSMVENDLDGSDQFLQSLTFSHDTRVIGLTGPPGAGKSTLLDAILTQLTTEARKVAVIAVDPTSPFTRGALLGDRVRMSRHFDNPNVFIRSFATRGALGGLPGKCHELCDVIQAAGFDYIFIETVGVGQAEVDVAGIADVIAVVLTPESGDEVQSMKAGLLEIADVFVVNKADHPGADAFVKHLQSLASKRGLKHQEIPVVRTVATTGEGVEELLAIIAKSTTGISTTQRAELLSEKLFRIIQQRRMRDLDRGELKQAVEAELQNGRANLYRLASKWD